MNIVAALRTTRAGAVEMPPRGKRGKLPERVSHPSHRAWKSGTRQPDSHISTAPAADLFIRKETRKDEKKTEFQLTDSITSSTIRTPASLRSENDQLHLGTGDRDQSKSPITFIRISSRWRCCRFVTPAAEPRNPLSYRQEIDDGEAVFFLPAGYSARISLTLLVAYVLA